MVRSPTARPTHRRGTLALPMEQGAEGYMLNTGGAYGGEMEPPSEPGLFLPLSQP